MRADPDAEFTTEGAARRLGMSPIELVRQFRQLTGVSPLRFRSALRIALAKRELVGTDASVTEIALRCGYDSLGTFIRTFTLRVGLPPSSFRQMARTHDQDPLDYAWNPGAAAESCVYGFAPDPAPGTTMLVAVGLFLKGVPAGRPLSGQVLINGGRLGLGDTADLGLRHLLGFAVPWGTSLWDPPESLTYVLSRKIKRTSAEPIAAPALKWRRLTVTDPPILLAIPAIISDQI
ncbi:MAG TPA: helix-turn-helix transcriptional regulator [Allosphingosinicella sp.]|nr:helix-turn-helix transcriptional regulator [Allosphingosinicella sp.]